MARTNHLIVRAAQAARGEGITFGKVVKSLLSLRDPDDKVVRAILAFCYSIAFIKIECPVSYKRSEKSREIPCRCRSWNDIFILAFSMFSNFLQYSVFLVGHSMFI